MNRERPKPFPIMESYVPNFYEMSNRINARIIGRQSQIDALVKLQGEDQLALAQVQEQMRITAKGFRRK